MKNAVVAGKPLWLKITVVNEKEAQELLHDVISGKIRFGCQLEKVWWEDPIQTFKTTIIEFVENIR